MNWIKRSWRGEEKLWKVFWIYGFILGFIFNLIYYVIEEVILIKYLGIIFYIIYFIWWAVSVWRCAFNSEKKIWGYLARVYVTFIPVLIVVGLLVGSILVGKDLIRVAECRKYIAEYERSVQAGVDPAQYLERISKDPTCIDRFNKKSGAKNP